MAADLLREGLTGVSAHVAEPYLDAVVRPQVLFPAYLAGFNLAEAYYLAMPFLSWQTVIIGDPLCRPFPGRPLAAEAISKGIDPETDMPALLTERRLRNSAGLRLNTEALKLVLKAEAAAARGDEPSVEPLLIKATDLEPRLTASNIVLAEMYTRRGDHAKTVDRYRRIVAVEPQNAIALNNLAYAIAVHQKKPAEALPYAQLAYKVAPAPIIADTLAWVHHLLGDDRTAAPLIEKATAGLPTHAELFFHAAIIHAALDDLARAKTELDTAEKLDPKLKEQPEVIALRAKMKGK
jgi:tetratricopeptide (TPR) repeat protein